MRLPKAGGVAKATSKMSLDLAIEKFYVNDG
jgi:hypothetical protein